MVLVSVLYVKNYIKVKIFCHSLPLIKLFQSFKEVYSVCSDFIQCKSKYKCAVETVTCLLTSLTFLQGSVDTLPLLSWQFAIIQVASTKVIDPVR